MKRNLQNKTKMLILTFVGIIYTQILFAQYGSNLVLNPGFESGAAVNWTKKFLDGSAGTLPIATKPMPLKAQKPQK